jgi:hypothetical protein
MADKGNNINNLRSTYKRQGTIEFGRKDTMGKKWAPEAGSC